MDFSVRVRFTSPVALVQLQGELDLSTEHHVGWSVQQAVDQGCLLVSVDLTGLRFLDCSGVGALVAARRRVTAAGGHLVVTGVHGQVARVLRWTAADHLLGAERGCPSRDPRTAPGRGNPTAADGGYSNGRARQA